MANADQRADVVVVGGGVLGLAHAIAAVRRGLSVALFERSDVARGASVRNFGMIWPIGQPPGDDLDTALRSRDLWREMAELAGFRCDPVGSLHVAHADDEWQVLREFAERSPLSGLQLWEPGQVVARSPCVVSRDLRGALFSPHEANVDPVAAVAALHAWLSSQGVHVGVACPVVTVADHEARLADGSVWHAEHVVVCSGDDFASLLPDAFAGSDLVRCRLQMLSLGPQPEAFALGPMLAGGLTLLHYEGFAACPSLLALRARVEQLRERLVERGIHVMVSQGDCGRLIVGDSHDYQPPFAPGYDSEIESLILDYLATFFAPPNLTVQRRWTGSYAKCRSGASQFRTRPLPGVEVVTGVGGSGMTRSLALGEQTVAAW